MALCGLFRWTHGTQLFPPTLLPQFGPFFSVCPGLLLVLLLPHQNFKDSSCSRWFSSTGASAPGTSCFSFCRHTEWWLTLKPPPGTTVVCSFQLLLCRRRESIVRRKWTRASIFQLVAGRTSSREGIQVLFIILGELGAEWQHDQWRFWASVWLW